MEKVIDYLYRKNHRMISPIGASPRQDIDFRCLGRIAMATSLGFEEYQATPLLKAVKPGSIQSRADLDRIIAARSFDDTAFSGEVAALGACFREDPNAYTGGGSFGPLTAASDILGAGSLLRKIIKEPQMVKDLVSYITSFIADLAKREGEAGAKFYWIAEPVASLLPPQKFEAFCGRYLKEIFTASGVPGYLHVCGPTLKHTRYMAQTGAQVLSIDSVTDLSKCIRMVDEDVVIMGNIDVAMMQLETPENVRRAVEEACAETQNLKNFILSTGCCMMENTPEQNILAFIEAGESYPCRSNDALFHIRQMIRLCLSGRREELESYAANNQIPGEWVQSALLEHQKFAAVQKEQL